MSRLLVDIHNHLYLPRYASLLRSRQVAPRILNHLNVQGTLEERLLILNDEPSRGRPVGPRYWDRDVKLSFMDQHGIDLSIVSSANPWLDFLPESTARSMATSLNEDIEEYCRTSPQLGSSSLKRIYGFGLLPLVPSISTQAVVDAVEQIARLPHLKGVIMGTKGVGNGLDDPELDPIWEVLERHQLVVFLHPHYGVGRNEWGPRENGHVLPLALGFPMETTIATTRLILSGVFDRFPKLKLLLAHSGGVLPQLSSRLASCIHHDPIVASRLKHDARYYLGQLWYDAVAYGSDELEFVAKVTSRGQLYIAGGRKDLPAQDVRAGTRRILFGTDFPFFPPLESEDDKWMSVTENLAAIDGVTSWTNEDKQAVRGDNALDLFALRI